MKQYISRIIVLAVLLSKALTLLIPAYSTPYLITAAVMLVLAAAVLFLGSEIPFASRIPWIGAAGVLVFYVLPYGPITMAQLTGTLEFLRTLALRFFSADGPGVLALGALIAMQLFFRRKANIVLIALRYLAALIFLFTLRDVLFYRSEVYYSNLILVTVCLCFVRELIACAQGTTKPSMLSCLLIVVFSLLIYMLFSYRVSDILHNFFLMDSKNWLYTVLLVFAFAMLTLLEDYCCHSDRTSDIYRLHNAGWLMAFWCLLAVIMHTWKGFSNVNVLLLGYPLGCAVLGKLMDDYAQQNPDSWGKVFFGLLGAMVLVLMMLAKSFNLGLLLRWTLLIFVLLVLIAWKTILKDNARRGLMETGTGIAAVFMLVTMKMTAWGQFGEDLRLVLAMALACGLLAMICSHQRSLEKQASAVYRAEYRLAASLNKYLPLALLAIASLKILFVL